ncbi:hypothetical protein DRE_04815 [Drechslerella stenobrocha 248]|uniref:Uncharacterized protein n=1 Tax=Drechslerella stenobrocha 248 TaxID=1043628 RepID=W7I0M7_9PEZI|nr:hypothetical protein DRE_04815 [Drechslerella stenobrocha 248]
MNLPLPSTVLLFWQSSIWKVIAAAGLGETIASRNRKALAESPGGAETPRAGSKRKHEDEDKAEEPPSEGPNDEGPPPDKDPLQLWPLLRSRRSERIASRGGEGSTGAR